MLVETNVVGGTYTHVLDATTGIFSPENAIIKTENIPGVVVITNLWFYIKATVSTICIG